MVKAYVRKATTVIKHQDGTISTTVTHDTAEMNRKTEDRHIQKAVQHFYKNRDIEPLVIEFREKNTGIYRSSEAMELMAAAMLGQSITGKGRTKTLAMLRRDYCICRAIYHLNKIGTPIKADADRGKGSACKMVGERFYLSAGAIYTIWREQEQSAKENNIFEITRWGLEGRTPSASEVTEHFYNQFASNELDSNSQG